MAVGGTGGLVPSYIDGRAVRITAVHRLRVSRTKPQYGWHNRVFFTFVDGQPPFHGDMGAGEFNRRQRKVGGGFAGDDPKMIARDSR